MGPIQNDYLSYLMRDSRISSVIPEGDGLLVTIDREPIRVKIDFVHRRTIIWALVRRLRPDEIDLAAAAALHFNEDRFDRDGLVMGLHKVQNILILGRSLDGDAVDEHRLLDALLELSGSIDDARDIFALSTTDGRAERDMPPANFIRV